VLVSGAYFAGIIAAPSYLHIDDLDSKTLRRFQPVFCLLDIQTVTSQALA
jgi:hypothetical protein